MPGGIRRHHSGPERALDVREILLEVFSHIQPSDASTAASMTRVNNLWWHMGFPSLFGQAEGQLSGLVRNVRGQGRRQMFANTVRHIHILPGDLILANNQNVIETLDFPRLESITYYTSNTFGMRPGNIAALMVPTLRSVRLGEYVDDPLGDQAFGEPEELARLNGDEDTPDHQPVLLNALSTVSAQLTTLTLPVLDNNASALVLDLLDKLEAIEHLDLGGVWKGMGRDTPSDVLLYKLLGDKQKLITLSPPTCCEFDSAGFQAFLRRVGPNWSLPSLRSIIPGQKHYVGMEEMLQTDKEPTFLCSMPAARVLSGMPNLERLYVTVEVTPDPASAASLEPMIASISKMTQLKELVLGIHSLQHGVDGDLLVQLGELSNLETLTLNMWLLRGPLSLNGTQLAAFLAGVPKLKKLKLALGKLDVSCTPVAKTAIDAAIARIEEVDLTKITFITEEAPTLP